MSEKKQAKVFGKPIKVELEITPYIESEMIRGELRTWLRFDLIFDGRHINNLWPVAIFCIADGKHYGEQSGPEWERLQDHWQKQYKYLDDNLGHSLVQGLLHLCGEAAISEKESWNLPALLADADLEEIDEWTERHSQANLKNGITPQYEDGDFRFTPHHMVHSYAREIWQRLKGEECECDDSQKIKWRVGFFDGKQYDFLLKRYEYFLNQWREARRIYNNRTGEHTWKEELEKLRYHLPDDLLDEMTQKVPDREPPHTKRWKYTPSDLALIHAARDARILSKKGTRLQMSHYSSLLRTLRVFADTKGKPRVEIKKEGNT